jgi:fucose permease
MSRIRVIVALALGYMVFAILLNSVGTVILQSIVSFHVDKPTASLLEACKDLTIAAATFVVATRMPRWGYRRAMACALILVCGACLLMPMLRSFRAAELLFVCIGFAFAMVKTAVYSSIGLLTSDRAGHASLTNLIEGLFMVGVVLGGWLFSAFIDPVRPENPHWLRVYWVLATLAGLAAALLATSELDETEARASGALAAEPRLVDMLRLASRPLVYCFLMSAFLYVLIEQSFGSWLPTFNREILHLPNRMSIQLATILAGTTAVGRIGAGLLTRRMSWFTLLTACIAGMAALVLLSLPLASVTHRSASTGWSNAPLAAYLLPMIGLMMAPIYPVINSVVLSSLPKPTHAGMTGLIIVFSALGGTLGSRLTAIVFARAGGVHAFYLTLIPMLLLFVTLYLFRRYTMAASRSAKAQA